MEKKKFVEISMEEFKSKFDLSKEGDIYSIPDQVINDVSEVDFSMENMSCVDGYMSYPVGFETLVNGMHVLFINAGGDWEVPVCFMIYWDGNELRGYVPKRGNMYNKKLNCAFGSDLDRDDFDYLGYIQEFIDDADTWCEPQMYYHLKQKFFYVKQGGEYGYSQFFCDVDVSCSETIIEEVEQVFEVGSESNKRTYPQYPNDPLTQLLGEGKVKNLSDFINTQETNVNEIIHILKKQLQKYVENEEYLKAAKIQEEIKRLEGEHA